MIWPAMTRCRLPARLLEKRREQATPKSATVGLGQRFVQGFARLRFLLMRPRPARSDGDGGGIGISPAQILQHGRLHFPCGFRWCSDAYKVAARTSGNKRRLLT